MHLATPRLGSRMTRIITTVGLVAGVTRSSRRLPRKLSAWHRVSVGAVHACVRTTAGDAKCWGFNDVGMVGDGTKIDRRRPDECDGTGRPAFRTCRPCGITPAP